jgi:hypothetical protein
MSTLFYHKCLHCLTPFTSTERHVDLCDCEGPVLLMGSVQGGSYVQTANKPACDGRCTHASGPHCDCACGGVNHGNGKFVTVVVKEGKLQVVDPDHDICEDMKRGYKYRELCAYAEKQYDTRFAIEIADRAVGKFVSRERFLEMRRVRAELDKVLSLKVYDKRHAALRIRKLLMLPQIKYCPEVRHQVQS